MKVLLIGGSTGREYAFAKSITASPLCSELYTFLWSFNPYIAKMAEKNKYGDIRETQKVVDFALEVKPDLVLLGQGEVIQDNLSSILNSHGIACIAPNKEMGRIEASKDYCRNLMEKINPDLNPRFKHFSEFNKNEILEFALSLGNKVVLKDNGLVNNIRVKIFDLNSEQREFLTKALEWIKRSSGIIVEEFISGSEIALLTLTDGKTFIHCPPCINYKPIFDSNKGDNTSGMGCLMYSKENSLTSKRNLKKLKNINEEVIKKLNLLRRLSNK